MPVCPFGLQVLNALTYKPIYLLHKYIYSRCLGKRRIYMSRGKGQGYRSQKPLNFECPGPRNCSTTRECGVLIFFGTQVHQITDLSNLQSVQNSRVNIVFCRRKVDRYYVMPASEATSETDNQSAIASNAFENFATAEKADTTSC